MAKVNKKNITKSDLEKLSIDELKVRLRSDIN